MTSAITRTPVTIITGFLGAGKTTLLNHLLRTSQQRFAVLVNDFGSINIDADLIVSVEGERISLTNGCICCRIRGDLLESAHDVIKRDATIDHILIETSGVSNPWPIVETFVTGRARRTFQLNAVITLVDAAHVWAHREHEQLIRNQILAADLVILNKCDLLRDSQREALYPWLRTLVPSARIVDSYHGTVAPTLVFDQSACSASEAIVADDSGLHTDASFASWSYQSEILLSRESLWTSLATLPLGIIRAKGFVSLGEYPERRVVVQMVGRRIDWRFDDSSSTAHRGNQLVLIGTTGALATTDVQKRFDACAYRTVGDRFAMGVSALRQAVGAMIRKGTFYDER